MKILITGSHFTPAQAIINELLKDPANEIVYIGRKYTREGDRSLSTESQVLPEMGVKFRTIITGRLQRTFTIYTIPSLLKIPIGIVQAFYYLIGESPDVILSFGGYVAVPIVIVGWLLSIPIIIHEQTLVSGLANSISSIFADKIALSFNNHQDLNKSKAILTGNPIRLEILDSYNNKSLPVSNSVQDFINIAKHDKLPLILVTGGNQGSHIINEAVEKSLDKLTKKAYIIHQTGDSKFQDFENLSEKFSHNKKYLVTKWIDASDMGYIFKNVDLVVSRAGINTLQELALFGIPTILIPIPYISRNEQVVNARFFEKSGLARILPQSKLNAESLIEEIDKVLNNLQEAKEEAKRAKEIVIPEAAKRLTLATILLAKKV